ncbi:INO80 complex subunit D-like [Papaver somniferum]|uniref:INO80 complex subunit D-like n=1 Tax=Papaver somniferum TaxID=3469 RepID=UPI000E701B5C|nr:INO80 complex subunit D-like [Papaver somniferum]
MVPVNKNLNQNQSKKETNPNQPSTSSDTEDRSNPNPNNNPAVTVESTSSVSPLVIEGDEEDTILKKSEYLTREEVIRRRLRRVRQMEKLYKDHYWSLMEELRVKYREYYWEYGKSPFKEEETRERGGNHHNNNGNGGLANGGGVVVEGSGDNHNNVNGGVGGGGGSGSGGAKLGLVNGGEDNNDGKYKRCVFVGCKSKPMALANHCHQHIILDSRQTLYKTCNYVTKSGGSAGTNRCGKTILSSNPPLLCSPHIQKAEKHVTRALRAAGLTNITSSSKLAPKLHIIVAEAVRQINAKRREKRAAMNNGTIEEANHAVVS